MTTIKEEYNNMRIKEGSLVYINPLYNPREETKKAYKNIIKGRSFNVIEIFDCKHFEGIEPIFVYQI